MINKKYYEAVANRRNIWEADPRSELYYQERLRYDTILKAIPSTAKTVLDLGCGDGYLSFLVASRGHHLIAYDLSSNRLSKFQKVAKQYQIGQVIGNVYSAGFCDESFDLVLCSEVIEHIENYQQVLIEAFRLLKPGGTFIVTVPYKENLKVILCPHCQQTFHENGHLHRFNKERLSTAIKEAGFTISRIKTMRHRFLVHLQYHTRMKYGFLLRTLDQFFSTIAPDLTIYLMVVSQKLK